MLHWGEDVDREKCKTCHAFRWKQKGHENASDHGLMVGKRQKELPANFL